MENELSDGPLEESKDKKRTESMAAVVNPPKATVRGSKLMLHQVFPILAITACCGLPLLLLAGSSLATLSLFSRTNLTTLAAGIILFVGAVILLTRRKGRNANTRLKRVKDDCCQ